jgi:glycosyltransferase involved in cell wall biosynthesis
MSELMESESVLLPPAPVADRRHIGRVPSPEEGAHRERERIRLLKFVTLFAIGGTERQVVNIGKGLDRARFDVEFACLHRVGELLSECREQEWTITEYNVSRLYGWTAWKRQLEFARHLRRQRIEILHTYSFYPNVFAIPAARLAGVPVVIGSVRDIGDIWTSRQHAVQRLCCRLADHIVVNAEAIKKDLLQRGYRAERVTVIPNGIDCRRFARPGDGERLRREFQIPPGAPVVGVLSRIMKIKGHEYFLQAAALIAARHPEVRFLIVGDTNINQDYREELKRMATRLGLKERVVFAGFRLDVPDLLASLSVSVLPSLGLEGLSNSLLESMAAGVPVVATRVGGTPEIVHDGVTGLLVPPADAEGLAAAILRLLEDRTLAGQLGQAGRRQVFTRYSLDRAVATTERLYGDLLHRVRRS